MEVTYRGDRCLRLRGRDVYVLLDPPAKIPAGLQGEVVVRTHGKTDSALLRPQPKGPQLIAGPGEFEVRGVAILGIGTEDATVMRVEVDDVRVVTVGSLQRQLTEDEIDELGHVDVLCVPLGAKDAMTPEAATKLARSLEPAVVIPLQESTDGGEVAIFAKEMGVADGWSAQPKLNLTGAMPSSEEIRVVILESRN
jgi:hypothetical protein